MNLDAAGKTDVGKNRDINEDYFYIDNSQGVFIVCDGIGGHAGGDVASHKAIEFTIEYLHKHWDEVDNATQTPVGYFKLTQLVERAIHATCRRINDIAEIEPALSGMGTTLTLLMVVDGNAIVGHVGDSRLYIQRDGKVFQLTTDHTLLNEITEQFKDVNRSDIQKFAHCLTRSVGNHKSVAVETLMFEARQRDVLLLCTDGLSSYFSNDETVAEMLNGRNVHEIADSLVEFANENGGKDNITAVVIRIIDVDDFQLNTRRIQIDMPTIDTEVES